MKIPEWALDWARKFSIAELLQLTEAALYLQFEWLALVSSRELLTKFKKADNITLKKELLEQLDCWRPLRAQPRTSPFALGKYDLAVIAAVFSILLALFIAFRT